MTDETQTLATLLGQTDAIWQPQRRWNGGRDLLAGNIWQAKRLYPARGVPWHSGRPDAAGRKAAERRRAKMQETGLLTTAKVAGRVAFVRLTERGEILARRLVDVPNLDEARGWLVELAAWGGLLVNECVVATGRRNANYGRPDQGRRLWQLQAAMLPVLCRGFAVARSDCDGRVYYMATDTGRAWLCGPVPELPSDLPPADPDAADAYHTAIEETLHRLSVAEPAGGEIGDLPIPVSGGAFRTLDGQPARLPRRRRRAR